MELPFAISVGDAAGIGPQVAVDAVAAALGEDRAVLFGDGARLQRLLNARGIDAVHDGVTHVHVGRTQVAHGASVYRGHENNFGVGKILLLLALLLTLVSMIYTQFGDHGLKFISLNKLILTNDLPIDAYIDNEFDEWLDSE